MNQNKQPSTRTYEPSQVFAHRLTSDGYQFGTIYRHIVVHVPSERAGRLVKFQTTVSMTDGEWKHMGGRVVWMSSEFFAFRFRSGNKVHKGVICAYEDLDTGKMSVDMTQRRGSAIATCSGPWIAEYESTGCYSSSWGKTA